MKKRFIFTILSACTLSLISGCTTPEENLWAECNLFINVQSSRSDSCLLLEQENVLCKLQKKTDNHINQLIKYNRNYHLYAHQIKTELSSNVPPQTLQELEQYLEQNQRAKELFERLVLLDSYLIPSARATITRNRATAYKLEQNIWFLRQKRINYHFNIPKEIMNRMGYVIQGAKAVSRGKISKLDSKDMTESREKILDEIRASLKT